MKKIFGIFGVAVIAATMFFSANTVNDSSTDLNLASLLSMNTANAECVPASDWAGAPHCNSFDRCSAFGTGSACSFN